jgi:hypothetical protein
MKADSLLKTELHRERLNSTVENVLADQIQLKISSAPGERPHGVQQRQLVLYRVQARDMDEARGLLDTPARRRAQRPMPEVHTERHSLRFDTALGDEVDDRGACARNGRGVSKHGAFADPAAPGNAAAVAYIG